MRLAGKRTIITGAASGMGRAGAELFAHEGARVVAVDVDAAALASAGRDWAAAGLAIEASVADLSDTSAIFGMVADCARTLGGIDVLWSHAGINGPLRVEGLDLALYDKTLSLNLTAAVIACGAVADEMRRAGGGSIILTSSTAGLVGSIQSPIYSATKFGLVGLAKSLALQFAPDRIRVNAICPGPVASAMLTELSAGRGGLGNGPEIVERLLASIPLGRFGEPTEIAEAVLWLASDASSFVTGAALPVDGGLTAR
jgi:NAD(P)-dependent dehydrogenase (short-subunit alcohol dehydrogenase family)